MAVGACFVEPHNPQERAGVPRGGRPSSPCLKGGYIENGSTQV